MRRWVEWNGEEAAQRTAPYVRVENDSHDQIWRGRTCSIAGTQIGDYKLLEQIGEKGMGVVYMAQQQQRPVRHRVVPPLLRDGAR